MNRAPLGAIVAEKMPNGSLKLEIGCRKEDEAAITEAVQSAAQATIDDTWGMFDRIRSHEEKGKRREALTEEIIRVVVTSGTIAVEVTNRKLE